MLITANRINKVGLPPDPPDGCGAGAGAGFASATTTPPKIQMMMTQAHVEQWRCQRDLGRSFRIFDKALCALPSRDRTLSTFLDRQFDFDVSDFLTGLS